MNAKLLEKCRELEAELLRHDDERECSLRESEGHLNVLVDHLTTCESHELPFIAQELKKEIHTLVLRARVIRTRLELLNDRVGPDVSEPLDGQLSQRVSQLREEVEGLTEYEKAALAVQREAHEAKGTFKDILKAMIMWKDTPEEKLEAEKRRAS